MYKYKKEDEDGGNPYHNMEKSSVLQESRMFNDTPIKIRKCGLVLTKILYLINQGEHIGTTEATETFFKITKLFQSKDITLRRMVYLTIKEMAKISEDVIIVTSSLTKDMTGNEDQFRAPAIRALCRITDASMLQTIERYLKQAIVDKSYSVSSAALTSSLHLSKQSPEIVKRWVNEAQEAASSDNLMVQYHALGLLYHIRKNDRLAVIKLVSKFSKHTLKSPYAYCLLIRIASKLMKEDESGISSDQLYDFIESCLRHKSEMVVYEAAHSIINSTKMTIKELTPAISVLQLFCASPKPTLRFAAVRTLNKVAMTHPSAVITCNLDLENLITDVNRSIATLAITTLLKTGNEGSVDRLMKQISSFMSEISDEFKIVVVQAVQALCEKFPRKHTVMMNFLSSMLRDEGGFAYKKAIVGTLISIVEGDNGSAKEVGLAHLCEFIEDCEHGALATRILHLLGREGPRAPQPSKYIRYIYNRVILEAASVRAAAVTALAKFGAHCDSLISSIIILLKRSELDTDDEVRDRSTFYVNILEQKQLALNSAYILNGLQVSIVGLERALLNYTNNPKEEPFDLKSVPICAEPLETQKTNHQMVPGEKSTKLNEKVAESRQDIYSEQLSKIPELRGIGNLFKSSPLPVELTESETEYNVRCVKHTFPKHIVFQYDCINTLNDQLLENVTVRMDSGDSCEVLLYVAIESLPFDKLATCYTLVKLSDDPTTETAQFSCTLKFLVKDCDPTTGLADDDGYDDEYVLEDVELTVADMVQRVIKANFNTAWEEIGANNELENTFALPINTLEDAIKKVCEFLGMQACERSDKVVDGKSSHTLLLSGMYRGGHDVLAKACMILGDGVTLRLTVRSSDEVVSEVIASCIG